MGALGRLHDAFWNREFVAHQLWFLIAVVTFGAMLLAGVLEFDLLARVVIVVGWFVLTPVFMFFGDEIAEAIFEADGADEESPESDDPLEVLRDRYARGEISEAEFERRVERLLETEDGPKTVREGGSPTLERASGGEGRNRSDGEDRLQSDDEERARSDNEEHEPTRE